MPVTTTTVKPKGGRNRKKKKSYAHPQEEWGLFVPYGSALNALPPTSVHPGW